MFCSIDRKVLSPDHFKVLECGHSFCKSCLQEWFYQNLENCLLCRQKESRELKKLNDANSFAGSLLVAQPSSDCEKLEIETLLRNHLVRRAKTVR